MRERAANGVVGGIDPDWVDIIQSAGTRRENVRPVQPAMDIETKSLEFGDVVDDPTIGHCHGQPIECQAHVGNKKADEGGMTVCYCRPYLRHVFVAEHFQAGDDGGLEATEISIDGDGGDEWAVEKGRRVPQIVEFDAPAGNRGEILESRSEKLGCTRTILPSVRPVGTRIGCQPAKVGGWEP